MTSGVIPERFFSEALEMKTLFESVPSRVGKSVFEKRFLASDKLEVDWIIFDEAEEICDEAWDRLSGH